VRAGNANRKKVGRIRRREEDDNVEPLSAYDREKELLTSDSFFRSGRGKV